MFTNASLLVSETVVTAVNGPLAAIPRKRLGAYARTDAATDAGARLGLSLPPEARFACETTATVAFAFGDLGEWIVQRALSPGLAFVLDLEMDVWALALDVSLGAGNGRDDLKPPPSRSVSPRFGSFLDERSCLGTNSKRGTRGPPTLKRRCISAQVLLALGVDANATRSGASRLFVGDVLDLDCDRVALALEDARFDWIAVNYSRTALDVLSSSFAPSAAAEGAADLSLERDIAASLIPATIQLVEYGFWDFTACAIDEFVRTDGRDGATAAARRAVAATVTAPKVAARASERCGLRRDWGAEQDDGALVALNESDILRRVADEVFDLDVAEAARSRVEIDQ